MKHVFALLTTLFLLASVASAQDSLRYYRLYLKDKGTPARTLAPGDPFYAAATAHLTPRALARRAKVLPANALVSTADLPVHAPYLEAIAAAGGQIVQRSRWLNAVMVRADSAAYEALRLLPFLDSSRAVFARRRIAEPAGKLPTGGRLNAVAESPAVEQCIVNAYGMARSQNLGVGVDGAHRLGLAGEGVLVGVLDAGFDWRNHTALKDLRVVGEYDFVNGDTNTADEPGESAEEHGTAVTSMIAGLADNQLIGGAPHASFLLAKTEDVRSERNVEEDHFVAGLEWMEAQGVDVTNTSLGYTEFDAPEQRHDYSALDGHTAFASRGANHATMLGVICVVAAGNEGAKGYRYVSVPAEADSAIAVAAVDSAGRIAPFSSRGFGGRTRIKPDVAAFGVGNWGANAASRATLLTGQGTSYASPMTTSVVALILSARPELRPYEVRELLYRTASRAASPDTAVGHGIVNADRALTELSRSAPVVGVPRAEYFSGAGRIVVFYGVRYYGGIPQGLVDASDPPTRYLELGVRKLGRASAITLVDAQPFIGVARWAFPAIIAGEPVAASDSVEVTLRMAGSGRVLRRDTLDLDGPRPTGLQQRSAFLDGSVLCTAPRLPASATTAVPNPFRTSCVIQYETSSDAHVTLTVHNVLGEEVARLADETMPAGFHTAFYQPENLPPGSYYYLLRSDGDGAATGAIVYLP